MPQERVSGVVPTLGASARKRPDSIAKCAAIKRCTQSRQFRQFPQGARLDLAHVLVTAPEVRRDLGRRPLAGAKRKLEVG